jgi:hypothetical protein
MCMKYFDPQMREWLANFVQGVLWSKVHNDILKLKSGNAGRSVITGTFVR